MSVWGFALGPFRGPPLAPHHEDEEEDTKTQEDGDVNLQNFQDLTDNNGCRA